MRLSLFSASFFFFFFFFKKKQKCGLVEVGEGGREGAPGGFYCMYNTRLNERDYNIKRFP